MVYFGRIQNGKVVPDSELRLPEGSRVRIEPMSPPPSAPPNGSGGEIDPVYRIGDDAVDDSSLPSDLASEHDHYIYGTPKRSQQQ